MPNVRDESSWVSYSILAVFVAISFFYRLAGYPLLDNNEGLYAEIAREMLVRHDFIIPHLNFVPYIEKPPLLYWLTALNLSLFGVNTWAARLAPALSAVMTCVALLYVKGQTHIPNVQGQSPGWLAALILASSIGFIIIGRTVYFDMLLTACLTWTLILFYRWYQTSQKHWLRLAYIALALGVLAKGLIAIVVAGSVSLIFMLLAREKRTRFRDIFDPVGIALFFLIATPWHVFAEIQHPGFFYDYFIN